MHARELVQLAATVAAHSPLIVQNRAPLPTAALQRYWSAAKCREEGWSHAIKLFTARQLYREPPSMGGLFAAPNDSIRSAQGINTAAETNDIGYWIQPILEEVLMSEVLTRVWTAVSKLADRERAAAESGPIAETVLNGHLEARQRVLNLMAYGYGLRMEEAVALNRLRLRNERWTDTLLAMLECGEFVDQVAFEPRRVRHLARSLRREELVRRTSVPQSVLLASLAAAYQRAPTTAAPHAEFNRQIACSVIACLPPHVFDSTGQPVSQAHLWLSLPCHDTRGKIAVATPTPPPIRSVHGPSAAPNQPHRRFEW